MVLEMGGSNPQKATGRDKAEVLSRWDYLGITGGNVISRRGERKTDEGEGGGGKVM